MSAPPAISKRLRSRVNRVVNGALIPLVSRRWRLIHVIEYPKCGGSWVRNMLAEYTQTRYFLDENNPYVRRGDVIKAHSLFTRALHRPIIVLRDPRDLFVSFYYYELYFLGCPGNARPQRYFTHDPSRGLRDDFAAYLAARLRHLTHPRFSYGQFVRSWLDRPGTCVVRYEDLLTAAEAQMTRIIRFLGLTVAPQRLHETVERHRFENRTGRKPGEADPTHFERKGVAGDWRNHFNAASCDLIRAHEGRTLAMLGYEPDDGWIERFLE